ncbi:MAG: hypothetical protein BWY47_00055 [Bacteroidetes bacterium ADurb.Bin302]|jgi:hypothetical protein|nr:MAG: hypothetical protein BWY47_00055 [Bacteroidetes bacterium ADurb.Bin302]
MAEECQTCPPGTNCTGCPHWVDIEEEPVLINLPKESIIAPDNENCPYIVHHLSNGMSITEFLLPPAKTDE